jgi:hypothetical protein
MISFGFFAENRYTRIPIPTRKKQAACRPAPPRPGGRRPRAGGIVVEMENRGRRA